MSTRETTAAESPHVDASSLVEIEGMSRDESARLIDEEFEALL